VRILDWFRSKGIGPTVLVSSSIGFLIYTGLSYWSLSFRLSPFQSLLATFIIGMMLTTGLVSWFVVYSKKVSKLEPDLPDPDSNDSDQDGLRHEKRVAAVRREAKRMRARVLKIGAIVSTSMFLTWLYFHQLNGATPSDVFVLPFGLVVLIWFLTIVLLPPWMTYFALVSVIGLRFAFELWGATILILLPNFLMLPFFYFFMMIFMFGSIMIPNLMQFKFYKPGDATWEVPKGTMRGQPEARAIVELEMSKFENYAKGITDRPATRGMIFEGPPGTGKTLLAKELGTEYDLPFAFTDAQAFNAPFMGFGPLVVYYFRWRTEQLAKEYGGAIVFIDEAETLLQQRSGMGQPGMVGKVTDVWDMFEQDEKGRVRYGDILVDVERPYVSPIFFGGGGMMGGANVAIFPFLTWLNGADGPPLMKKIMRRKFNDLLNALCVPTVVKNKVLRLPPGKPENQNLMFIAATNRAWMLDDAIRRPGRFGVTVRFKVPDFKSRVDVAELYFSESVRKGWMLPELNVKEKHEEFARSTQGMSPAEIEAVIKAAPDVRIHHVENLKRIHRILEDLGQTSRKWEDVLSDDDLWNSELLTEEDRKFMKRHHQEVDESGNYDYRADWRSLMEARSQVLWGRAAPGMTSEAHIETTAIHEFMGHFIQLKAFMGEQMRPQVLTVMPRGTALGMVAYVPVEERDPMPQSFYEGMLRVSLGSIIAERFFYGENQPGVTADLENATSVATFMVAKCAMVPYGWGNMSEEDRRYYANIGATFRTVPDSPNPMAKSVLDKVMGDPVKREKVEVFLGMAAVDAYRLIRANAHLAKPVVDELLEVDEFSGARLEELWDWLDQNLATFTNGKMEKENLTVYPDRHFAYPNPFYGHVDTEAKEILE
jgi:cell division protease FtsH